MAKQQQFEKQLLKYLLVATLVPAIALVFTLWYYDASSYLIALIVLSLFCLTGYCAATLYQKITFQLRTLSNLLEGMIHGDYSLRGRRASKDSKNALGQLITQINALADTLLTQRYQATESQLLVAKIIQHIDVAILAIDDNQQVALVNPAAEALLNVQQNSVLGKPIQAIGAEALLNVKTSDAINLAFAGKAGKFKVICDHYREHGHQHQLFFITDVNLLLRKQERQAWQDLIRVLSHEINNSLSPIASLAKTLKGFTSKIADQNIADSYNEGLEIIGERANSLGEFIKSYRQFTHLPAPKLIEIDLANLLGKIPTLFERKISLSCPTELMIRVDAIQIEQVLINLIKNADEATSGNDEIEVIVEVGLEHVTLEVIDNGCGLSNTDNLFTPFYTTKKTGSGIGLALSRQIIEAHNGQLTLKNRNTKDGCIATVTLPFN